MSRGDARHATLEISILGTVLYEPILVGLRRAFHEHFSTHLVRGKRASRPRRRR